MYFIICFSRDVVVLIFISSIPAIFFFYLFCFSNILLFNNYTTIKCFWKMSFDLEATLFSRMNIFWFCSVLLLFSVIPFPFLSILGHFGPDFLLTFFCSIIKLFVVASTLWFADWVFCILSQIFSGLRAWWLEGRVQLSECLVISELWPHF